MEFFKQSALGFFCEKICLKDKSMKIFPPIKKLYIYKIFKFFFQNKFKKIEYITRKKFCFKKKKKFDSFVFFLKNLRKNKNVEIFF